MTHRIHVVSGLASRRNDSSEVDEIFFGLRPPGATRSGLWELPGGKVEPGETPQGALAREWVEELDVDVVVGDRLATATLDLVDQILQIELFEVHPREELSPDRLRGRGLYHADTRWIAPRHAVEWIPCSPGYYLHYPSVATRVEGQRLAPTRRARLVRGVATRTCGSGQEVLLGLRRPDVSRPEMWDLPGGVVEPGEDERVALARAWRDEFGVAASVGERVATTSLDLVDPVLQIDLFEVSIPSSITPRITPRIRQDTTGHHAEIGWARAEDAVRSMPCAPDYYLQYPSLVSWLGRGRAA